MPFFFVVFGFIRKSLFPHSHTRLMRALVLTSYPLLCGDLIAASCANLNYSGECEKGGELSKRREELRDLKSCTNEEKEREGRGGKVDC